MMKSVLCGVAVVGCYLALLEPAFHASDWQWNEDPVDFMQSDQVAVCVTVDGNTGAIPLIFELDGDLWVKEFQPSSRGQCAVLDASDVQSLVLLPNRQHMFLQTALIAWADGRSSQLSPPSRPGGWRLE